MSKQDQFLEVIDRDTAQQRYRAQLELLPTGIETIALSDALGRVLAEHVAAPVDVPGFDRSNVDGFAVRASDTFGASENEPRELRQNSEEIGPGIVPEQEVAPGTATPIATGAMLPRGADAVVMVEHTDTIGGELHVLRPVTPGEGISYAGTDIARGEIVLRRRQPLSSRETGVLAAIGLAEVSVYLRPRVAILSTGDEIIAPGQSMRPGLIYDSNAIILADAVRELGGEPVSLGVFPDDEQRLSEAIDRAIGQSDLVLLSGGTSKGAGDLNHRVVGRLTPGIVVHGVALKPGKPICLAVAQTPAGAGRGLQQERRVPVVILPGFPTSAIFTFHEFVAPLIRVFAGRARPEKIDAAQERGEAGVAQAVLPMRVNSERGRTEYVLVNLIERVAQSAAVPSSPEQQGRGGGGARIGPPLVAYPMGKGSGSVTTFSRADGFVTIERNREYLDEGEIVAVQLLGKDIRPADLVVIGSHCVGLDLILARLHEQGYVTKVLAVGSHAGLAAVQRGECDVAGIHLLDPETDTYNSPFLSDSEVLEPGYTRQQGIVFRRGDGRFEGRSVDEAVRQAVSDHKCCMVNRNRGSGTRVLLDGLLGEARPPGYALQPRSHQAVGAAVAQGRADWGLAIETVAAEQGLGFLPVREECFDFAIPRSRIARPAVTAFRTVLNDAEMRDALRQLGFASRCATPSRQISEE